MLVSRRRNRDTLEVVKDIFNSCDLSLIEHMQRRSVVLPHGIEVYRDKIPFTSMAMWPLNHVRQRCQGLPGIVTGMLWCFRKHKTSTCKTLSNWCAATEQHHGDPGLLRPPAC